MAADVDQRRLGALAQRDDVDPRRDREEDVAQAHALAGAERLGARGEVTATVVLGGRRKLQGGIEMRVDRGRCGFAYRAAGGGRVVGGEQAGALRGLPQQLRAGALAQVLGCQRLSRRVQVDSVDPGGSGDGR